MDIYFLSMDFLNTFNGQKRCAKDTSFSFLSIFPKDFFTRKTQKRCPEGYRILDFQNINFPTGPDSQKLLFGITLKFTAFY